MSLELTLFDTWSWDLWHAGRVLIGDGRKLHVLDRRDLSAHEPSLGLRVPPRFAWEQPQELTAITGPVIGMRAVLPQARLPLIQRWWNVRNTDEKIVVKLLDQRWGDDARTLQIVPLRGYEWEAQAVLKSADALWRSAEPPLRHGLEAAGIRPREWSSKPFFELDPRAPALEVAVRVMRSLLARAVQTEPGIVADDDTEFLHDYRVLVRRARAVLSIVRGVFHEADAAELERSFKALGRETNLLRDLDVHLLDRARQETRVPEGMRAGLGVLFADLLRVRGEEHARLARRLKSAGYRRELESLDRALAHARPGPRARRGIRKLADKRVLKAIATVLEDGLAITPETPDAEVHALRIDCKELRYTLELFRDLYPAGPVSKLVRRLKALQDVLGSFNDLCMQLEFLQAWAEDRPRLTRDGALSLGALMGTLDRERSEVRSHVEESFAKFNGPNLYRLVEKIVGRPLEVVG